MTATMKNIEEMAYHSSAHVEFDDEVVTVKYFKRRIPLAADPGGLYEVVETFEGCDRYDNSYKFLLHL